MWIEVGSLTPASSCNLDASIGSMLESKLRFAQRYPSLMAVTVD